MPYIEGEQWGPLIGAAKARLGQGWTQDRTVEWLRAHPEFGFVSRDQARSVVHQAAGERYAAGLIAEGQERATIGSYFAEPTGPTPIVGVYVQFYTEGELASGELYRQRHGFAMNVPAGMPMAQLRAAMIDAAMELAAAGGSFGLAQGTVVDVTIDTVRAGGYHGALHELAGEEPI